MPAGGYVSEYLAFWGIWFAILLGTWIFFRRTRGRTGLVRLVAGNALVLLSFLWTAVLAGETYLRYFCDFTDQYGLTLTNFAWFRRHIILNSAGCRDREFRHEKAPGVTRVACVGDSFTMGWGVPDPADAFPQRIGKALEARAPGKFEVWNVGFTGATTGHEAGVIDSMAVRDSIDRIVLGYCLNDPDDLLPHDRWFIREKEPRPPVVGTTTSFLADYLWFHLRLRDDPRVRGYFDWEIEAYEDPRVFGAQCDRFKRIADTCKRASIRLDVVVFPFFSDWGEKYRFDSCHDRVAGAWKRLGVDVIDLREAYRGIPAADLYVSRFDGHPNARAHDIAARTILERVFPERR
jgi:lysophospholipase L1-like esterase